MATRIYQGRVLSAEFEAPSDLPGNQSAIDSLIYTFELFQDAVNYHLVALAGMIPPSTDPESTLGKFRNQIEAIWSAHPKDKAHAQTLQHSVTKTLCISQHASLEETLNVIYANSTAPELLPYVLQLILERTGSGDGAIQQEGRSLLPKLCDVHFSGNFDYSTKEKKAAECKRLLQRELNSEDITEEELVALAEKMDLSWAGIKTQPNSDHTDSEKFDQAESSEKISETLNELCQTLQQQSDPAWKKYENEQNISLYSEVTEIRKNTKLIVGDRLLAKNNKAAASLKQAAIFFMYYPCKISADMLRIKLGKEKKQKNEKKEYDCATLPNDPILICRGERGFVYKGFSALAEWETSDNEMYSNEWDILAFKEALKTLHSFELKTEERNRHVAELENDLRYMETGEGKPTGGSDDEYSQMPVLGGDPRFELLKNLVQEIAPDDYDEYTISYRALRGFDEIVELWKKATKNSTCSETTLIDIVRKSQSTSDRFGAGPLFEALCLKKYQPIWQEWVDDSKRPKPRSENILQDFARYQELQQEITQYKETVRITAAEPTVSPRQLLFSDLNNFGPKSKGHEYVKGQNGVVRLRVATRNENGRLQASTIRVRYSAPRFERDELGTDPGSWIAQKKGTSELTSWLQPMMKALNLPTDKLHMSKEPALGLQVKRYTNATSCTSEPVCLLNFPVTLDFDIIHHHMGKADLWKDQMLGGTDEKLHLHWPGTYAGKSRPWWESEQLKNEGFRVLGIDLGVRYAAAWALTDVRTTAEIHTAKGTALAGRSIGKTGNENWYGFCTKNGLIKLDGEGRIQPRDTDGVQAPSGVGKPTPEDIQLAKFLLDFTDKKIEDNWNILTLGNKASRAFRILLFRCRKFQSLLVKLKDAEKQEHATAEALDYFEKTEITKQLIPGIIEQLHARNFSQVQDMLLEALLKHRNLLPKAAVKLTNLILPRKHGEWVWQEESSPGYIGAGKMVTKGVETPLRRIFNRGGLSIQRLTQIEELRKLLQSMNRILHETPGVRAEFGAKLRDIHVVDPCPDILRKIENIREQRVNKIAHEITALALGLQLKAPRKNKNTANRDIIHGEYEVIPNRKPVDFVVLENLSRYRTSIDRTPSENSTLMRWAHRQIVAKVKQLLEEVFGIPVLCTHAAYTSKFDAFTSAPGFRAEEMKQSRLDELYEKNGTTNEEKQMIDIYRKLLKDDKEKREGFKLLMPGHSNNGAFFLSRKDDGVCMRNADINAAINIAWRGIASPEAHHLLHRLRLNRKKGKIVPVYTNKREKALEKTWAFTPLHELESDNQFSSAFWQSEQSSISPDAQYGVPSEHTTNTFLYGKKLWGTIKSQRWELCHLFNLRVLKKVSANVSALEKHLSSLALLQEDDSDIPL